MLWRLRIRHNESDWNKETRAGRAEQSKTSKADSKVCWTEERSLAVYKTFLCCLKQSTWSALQIESTFCIRLKWLCSRSWTGRCNFSSDDSSDNWLLKLWDWVMMLSPWSQHSMQCRHTLLLTQFGLFIEYYFVTILIINRSFKGILLLYY